MSIGFAQKAGTNVVRSWSNIVRGIRPGASTNIGTKIVANAWPDGYTLLAVTSANAINASLYDDPAFNFIRDIAPVAIIGHALFVMVVNPALPARTIPEFIAYAKANPHKINMGSPGVGTLTHVDLHFGRGASPETGYVDADW